MLTDREKKNIFRELKTAYTTEWTQKSASIPLFEIRVSLAALLPILKKYNLTPNELYHILEQEAQLLLK